MGIVDFRCEVASIGKTFVFKVAHFSNLWDSPHIQNSFRFSSILLAEAHCHPLPAEQLWKGLVLLRDCVFDLDRNQPGNIQTKSIGTWW